MKIEINNLSKIYGNNKHAIDDINLQITDGLFGLLGPNGAGKTTLMRILVTLMKPSAGEVFVNGMDLQKERKNIRKMLGYLPQEFSAFPKIRTWEFLDFSARLAGMNNKKDRTDIIDRLLESVGLFEARDRLASKLSGGMKRRLGIAQALIGNPQLLVVDEPTTGLDPEERIRFRNLLAEMGSEERIIILSTHIVGDISSSCTEMALLNEGKLGFNGQPQQLIENAKGHTWQFEVPDSELENIKTKYPVVTTIPSEKGWQVQFVHKNPDEKAVISIEPNLEHAYVYFMENMVN